MSYTIAERITVNIEQCGGRPCIRVVDILELLAAGLSFSGVLEELPDLEMDDLFAVLKFATSRVNHPVLVAA